MQVCPCSQLNFLHQSARTKATKQPRELSTIFIMKKLFLIFHTVKHLRPIQIRFQLWFRIRRIWRKLTGFTYPLSIPRNGKPLHLKHCIDKQKSYDKGNFTFLNIGKEITHPFDKGVIRLREEGVSKLWRYNLYYMDYLLQPGIGEKTGMDLIDKFIQSLPGNPEALEPYPIALRGINWIKFLSKHLILNTKYSSSLHAQYIILLDNLEYHLMGNHLLEDGFSLLFGAFYFNDELFLNKAKQILESELNEQILDDGAHFELSPMYHQIILDRLLDCINIVQNNKLFSEQINLLNLMQNKAGKMAGWLNIMTFSNGRIPLLNDSTVGIAPSTEQLNNYAQTLNIVPLYSNLSASGYRRYNGNNFECIIDIGQLGSSYQPGHAHADTFNFVIDVNGKPLIVDTGISTYEADEMRKRERGTPAHNTVSANSHNSSNMWASFRVAQRAKVALINDDKSLVIARHNGFKNIGFIHQREWKFEKDKIAINDLLTGTNPNGVAHFHFAPGLIPQKVDSAININNITIKFNGAADITFKETQIPDGYNRFTDNFNVNVGFKKELSTIIEIKPE